MSLAWGGFTNGAIPLANLVEFEGTGKYLQADAAASLTRLFDATERATGARPYVAAGQDLNRDLAEQVRLLKHNYRVVLSGGSIAYGGERWAKKPGVDPTTGRAYVTCATPGSSNHGWARAGDISFPTAASRAWFRAHCTEYDWYNSGDAFGEDWHKEFHGAITTTAGSGTPITVKTEEEDDMAKPVFYVASSNNPSVTVGKGDIWVREYPSDILRRVTNEQAQPFFAQDGLDLSHTDRVISKPGEWFDQAFKDDKTVTGYTERVHQ